MNDEVKEKQTRETGHYFRWREETHDSIVRVSIWSTNEGTIKRFRNECKREGLSIIDEFPGRNGILFKLRLPSGKRIFLPCKGEVDIWPNLLTWQM